MFVVLVFVVLVFVLLVAYVVGMAFIAFRTATARKAPCRFMKSTTL
ncbi:hypothetical protein ACFCXP_03750 [Streptomyces niveus]